MKNIKEILEKRNTKFEAETKIVIDELTDVLQTINQFFSKIETLDITDNITWDEMDLTKDGLLLTLVGFIEYDVGTEVIVNGEQVMITAENKTDLGGMLDITLPLDLIMRNDQKEIMEFLRELNVEQDNMTNESALHETNKDLLNDLNGFDLSLLTDEQIKALVPNTTKKK